MEKKMKLGQEVNSETAVAYTQDTKVSVPLWNR